MDIKSLSKNYIKDPNKRNEELLFKECLIHIKMIVKISVARTPNTDAANLESYLHIRTVQMFQKNKGTSKFCELFPGFILNMVKNYYKLIANLKINKIIFYSGNIEYVPNNGMTNTFTDTIEKLNVQLNPLQLGIVKEIDQIGHINLAKIGRNLGCHPRTVKRHIEIIRVIIRKLEN